MKILYCLNQIGIKGGVERVISAKANWLVAHGYDVSIVTTDQDNLPTAYELDPKVKHLDIGINYHKINYLGYCRHYFQRMYTEVLHRFRLKKIIDSERPDIIISTSYQETTILPSVKGTSKLIFEQHNCRSLFKNPEYFNSWQKTIERYLRKRWFKTLHKYHVHVFLNTRELNAWNLEKSIVIPNFVTMGLHNENRIDYETKTVIHVGRLSWEKNQKLLLEAWKIVALRCPDWKLVICGEGPEKDTLVNFAAQLGISKNVVFNGNVEDINYQYNNSDIFVLTSLFESFGLSVAEAMSHGLPIVTTDFGGSLDDLIKDGFNGYVVRENKPDSIAEKLILLIESAEQRKIMGHNSRIAIKRYAPDIIMNRWVQLFNSLKF